MGFNENLKELAKKVLNAKGTINTEEATKMSMIIPFFSLLGYNVFDHTEFCPEFTADVGIKKGEKVDYAILINGTPEILIECKCCSEQLAKHGSQLFRYFGVSKAKFGILTNGVVYQFYTDLDEPNKMDMTPFLEINMEDLKDIQINELRKFSKDAFDKDNIFSTASELKYSTLIKSLMAQELDNPSDEFIRYILSETYDGQKTQKVIDRFKPIIKKSFNGFINEVVNQKISSALTQNDSDSAADEVTIEEESQKKIVTTQEELESFYIIRGILAGIVKIEDITYRDTESYFSVLYKNNKMKPICRINLDRKNKQIYIPDENKTYERIYINSVNDIYMQKDKLINVIKRYI